MVTFPGSLNLDFRDVHRPSDGPYPLARRLVLNLVLSWKTEAAFTKGHRESGNLVKF